MIFVLAVAVAMAAFTWLLGWWGVLLVAAIVGIAFRERDAGAWRAALAAGLAWAALLAIDTLAGPLGTISATLGGVMRIPGVVLVLVTLLFPALLAWSAAAAASESRRLLRRRD
jgi:hypothetical protein